MSYFWEVFPRVPWPRMFGKRESSPIFRELRDPHQLEFEHVVVTATPPAVTRRGVVEHLLELLAQTDIAHADFAHWVLGCNERTLFRYLHGGRIPEQRRNWIARLERIELHQGGSLTITLRPVRVARRRRKLWKVG